MNQKNPNPQTIAAVTQTLAGERMSITVNFPTTGDPDCDFIQGILAVKGAIVDMWPGRAELVLRYMADRFKNIEDNCKQPSQVNLLETVRQAVHQGLYEQQLRQSQPQPNQPWYGSVTSAGSCPPGVISSQATASQIQSIQQMVKGLDLKP